MLKDAPPMQSALFAEGRKREQRRVYAPKVKPPNQMRPSLRAAEFVLLAMVSL